MADVSPLMFSHIDQNMAGLAFPAHNFVFTPAFIELLEGFRKEVDVRLSESRAATRLKSDFGEVTRSPALSRVAARL